MILGEAYVIMAIVKKIQYIHSDNRKTRGGIPWFFRYRLFLLFCFYNTLDKLHKQEYNHLLQALGVSKPASEIIYHEY